MAAAEAAAAAVSYAAINEACTAGTPEGTSVGGARRVGVV